jgi:hypothetical protein
MSSPDDKPDELAGTEQPFVSHLIELRDRLVRCVHRGRRVLRRADGLARLGRPVRPAGAARWSRSTCRRAAR